MDNNTLSSKLNRINDSLDRIRVKTSTEEDVIEEVAQAVEDMVVPEGNINITSNGSIDIEQYKTASVNVPGIIPVGTKNISSNGDYDITNYATAHVEISSGGVFFLDYDGTLVETWAIGDVASKTALPDNPTHTGLTAQGWNWSLQSIKDYAEDYPEASVYVGQMYRTTSGLTEIDITVTKVTGLTVTCKMAGNKDWGDGTQDNLTTHTYEDYGNYTITCDGTSIPEGSSSSGGMFDSTSSNVNRYWCTAIRIGNNVTSIGGFQNCFSLHNITIPDSVTSIGNAAFYNCNSLTNVTIPDSVTSIGDSAFYFCYSLHNIMISDSVTSISNHAFNCCSSLINVTMPKSITSIGSGAFRNCYSLTNVTVSDSVTSISDYAFNNCNSLTNVTIPDSVTSIGDSAFQYCYSLQNITIPDSVTNIGRYAFNNCYALHDITILGSITSIGSNTFQNCYALKNITIPDSVTDIGVYAFNNCYVLRDLTMSNNITSIGNNAFYNCYALKNITMPKSITSIGNYVFFGCNAIIEYNFTSVTAIPTLSNTNAFNNINGICKIVVPDNLYDSWKAASKWSTYANYIVKASEYEEIGE